MNEHFLRVDMHLHIGRSRDGAELTLEEIRKSLDEHLLTHAVLFPIDEPNPGPSYGRLNTKVAQVVKQEKRLIGFCRLNPHHKEEALQELKRAKKMGLRGVKLHPRSEDFTPTDLTDLMVSIEKERFPVVLHTSHEHHCHPIPWEGIFLRHKKISFILAHAGKDAYRDAVAVAKRCPNVYLDTSTLSFRRTGYILQKVGPEKVVFASDAPYSHPAIELLKFDLLLNGKTAARRKIFEENPKRILGGFS